jgi:hypothetical protein
MAMPGRRPSREEVSAGVELEAGSEALSLRPGRGVLVAMGDSPCVEWGPCIACGAADECYQGTALRTPRRTMSAMVSERMTAQRSRERCGFAMGLLLKDDVERELL